jgi:hypothetical protein
VSAAGRSALVLPCRTYQLESSGKAGAAAPLVSYCAVTGAGATRASVLRHSPSVWANELPELSITTLLGVASVNWKNASFPLGAALHMFAASPPFSMLRSQVSPAASIVGTWLVRPLTSPRNTAGSAITTF